MRWGTLRRGGEKKADNKQYRKQKNLKNYGKGGVRRGVSPA